MQHFKRIITSGLLALTATSSVVAVEVPIGDFFKDPEFTSVSLSPSGEYISVSKPQGDRTVLAIFKVADMSLQSKFDYGDRKHIDRVSWVSDDRFFMFVTEKVGRFDARVGRPDVYAANVDGGQRADIPNGGTYSIVDKTWDDPKTILVSRSIDSAYLSKLNVYTGEVRTVATAPLDQGTFVVDNDGKVRYAVGINKDLQSRTYRRDGDEWVLVHSSDDKGSVRTPLGFAPDNKQVYFSISDKGEPTRLVVIDPDNGKETLVSHNPNVEISGYVSSSGKPELLALAYEDGIPYYDFVNKKHPDSKAFAGLINSFNNHVVAINGISRDGRYILFRAYSDMDPGTYYLFDRQQNKAKFLLSARDWIKPDQMSEMRPITVTARDGLELHGYITIPRFSDEKKLPLILHPHGGPHGPRDSWGFNPEVQFLANRGYAVMQINFRGSGGYGNEFERKGHRNWGTSMIDDMTDAVQWAVKEGIADPNRVCTYGASYGGYAALQSIVREPTRYKCTIGYVGLYGMDLWMRDSDVARSESGRNYQAKVFPETPEGRRAQSAAFNVDKINVPVMLVHGAKDLRVPISQYKLLMEKLTAAGKAPEVTIVEEKEGHGFYDYQNQVDLYTAMEAFLDKHIGNAKQRSK